MTPSTQPKTKPTHTPTPWELYSGQETLSIRAEGMNVLFDCPTTRQSTVDAAFIVRAVNAHEKFERLLNALTRWTDHGNMPKYDSLMPDDDQTFGEAIEELQALAKAEGAE